MTQSFTDDDLEKRVENANGELIGTVTAVEGDTARVEPSAGVMDSIRAALGWERAHEDTVLVHADAIGERSDDVIRLEADEPTRGEPATAVGESESEPASETDRDRGGDDHSDDLEAETELEADSTTERGSTGDDSPMGRPEEPDGTEPRASPESDGVSVDETRAVEGMDGTGELEPEPDTDPEPDSQTEFESESEPNRGPESDTTEGSNADGIDLGDGADWTDETDESDDAGETESPAAAEEPDSLERASEPDSRDVADVMDDAGLVDDTAITDEADATDDPDTDPADELDPGVDIDSIERSVDTDEAGGTEPTAATEERDSADELDPGVDVDSLEETREESDRSSAGTVDTETLAEGRTDAELGLETAARRIGPEIDPGPETVGLADEETADRRSGSDVDVEGEVPAEGGEAPRERDRITGHASSPFAAAFTAQRTAIEQGQQVIGQGTVTHQRLARTALEGQARVQRQSLEVFRAATTGYFETIAATARAATDRGSAGDRPGDEQLTGRLRTHLERLQELQDRLDERVDIDHRHERTTDLLEEQLEQVQRLQQELSADRLELVGGLDSMYRERLEAASITSLEELARADTETVADAADVTEKRAESWIEQAEARV